MGEKFDQWATIVVMVLQNVAMGSVNALVKKALDVGTNHMVIATYRLAISALFLAPFAYFWERKTRPKLTFSLLCQHFVSGLLGASLNQYFLLLGLSYTSATISCAFLSMLPAITFTLTLIFRTETLNLKTKAGIIKVLGTLICVGGALLLTFYKGLTLWNLQSQTEGLKSHPKMMTNNKTENWLLGCLFLFLGSSFLSSWLLYQAKINAKYPCSYSSTVLMSIFASVQCSLLTLTRSRGVDAWILRDKFVILVVIYAGVLGQAVPTVALSWTIKKRGPVFASAFYPVMLISATLMDVIILHNPLYLGSIIGSIITITGLYIFLWGKNKDIEAGSSLSPTQPPEAEEHKKTESEDNNAKLPV